MITFNFVREMLDAMQDSDKFECLFSASSSNGVAEVYITQSETGTHPVYFVRESGDSDSGDSAMAVTESEEEVQKWVKEKIAHLSYNYECEGEFDNTDDMPDALLPDFAISINSLIEETEAQPIAAS